MSNSCPPCATSRRRPRRVSSTAAVRLADMTNSKWYRGPLNLSILESPFQRSIVDLNNFSVIKLEGV
jgi:hypothetical protein